MKACFQEHGQNVDLGLLERHGIKELVIPAVNSPAFNVDIFLAVKGAGIQPAVGVSWDWYGPMEGYQFARKCDEVMRSLGPRSPNPPLWADIEALAYLNQNNFADFIAAFVVEWRRLRRTRATRWTLNPFQGACFNGKFSAVQTVMNNSIDIVVQHYVTVGNDQMYPADGGEALKDLVTYGFPANAILSATDAKKPPFNWNGLLWTTSRLP